MPTLVAAELSAWLEERHSELHDAFLQGDNTRVNTEVVGRNRAHGGDDRRDAQLSVLLPPWRAVGGETVAHQPLGDGSCESIQAQC